MNENYFRRLFPNASRSTIEANCGVCDPKPEQNQAPALDKTVQGEIQSVERPIVRFNLCRTRLLDKDNADASVKDLLDGLQRACLIADDNTQAINLQVEQTKVETRREERTEIEIIYSA